ncbi:MAG: hypothetical protein SGCHY_001158 [Lobulomycetales sp.]
MEAVLPAPAVVPESRMALKQCGGGVSDAADDLFDPAQSAGVGRNKERARLGCALPFIVGVNPWIKGVFELYRSSFEKLRCFPEITSDDLEARFTATLEDLVIEHQDVTTNLARGFGECGTAYMSQADRTNFLDGMINARIGIRILAENHLALQRPADPEWIGVVHKSFSPAKLITAVGNHCREICNVNYGSSPEFIINGTGAAATFPYIPNHVEYIIMELMKNAMRATVEHSTKTSRMDHPPIEVTIVQGEDDIAIRLRDQGGGIPAPLIPFVFDYSFTTVRKDEDDDAAAHDMFSAQTIMQNATGGPMAGLGFGLPMSRNYAKYFGGSLEITSISGHGADVFIHLPDPFRTEKFLE